MPQKIPPIRLFFFFVHPCFFMSFPQKRESSLFSSPEANPHFSLLPFTFFLNKLFRRQCLRMPAII
jgi:hypothetical protein